MKRIFYFAIAMILVFPAVANAEWVQGTVLDADPEKDTITIKRTSEIPDFNYNLPPQIQEQLSFKAGPEVDLYNFAALEELQPGSQVRVNLTVNENDPSMWQASAIELQDIAMKKYRPAAVSEEPMAPEAETTVR